MNAATQDSPHVVDPDVMRRHAEEAATLLQAVANSQRLRILCYLMGNELTVSQLNERLPDLSPSALSQHLAKLRHRDLVATRPDSQRVWYSLREGAVQALLEALYGIFCEPGSSKRASRGRARRAAS